MVSHRGPKSCVYRSCNRRRQDLYSNQCREWIVTSDSFHNGILVRPSGIGLGIEGEDSRYGLLTRGKQRCWRRNRGPMHGRSSTWNRLFTFSKADPLFQRTPFSTWLPPRLTADLVNHHQPLFWGSNDCPSPLTIMPWCPPRTPSLRIQTITRTEHIQTGSSLCWKIRASRFIKKCTRGNADILGSGLSSMKSSEDGMISQTLDKHGKKHCWWGVSWCIVVQIYMTLSWFFGTAWRVASTPTLVAPYAPQGSLVGTGWSNIGPKPGLNRVPSTQSGDHLQARCQRFGSDTPKHVMRK